MQYRGSSKNRNCDGILIRDSGLTVGRMDKAHYSLVFQQRLSAALRSFPRSQMCMGLLYKLSLFYF